MTQATLQGGCLCGAVRYRLSGEPKAVVACHCTHCQRQSGSLFSVNLVVDAAQYQQEGHTRRFRDTGDSGKAVWRHFCETCGSPLYSDVEARPGALFVKAGTLDDRTQFAPTVEVYTDHAAGWLSLRSVSQSFTQSR